MFKKMIILGLLSCGAVARADVYKFTITNGGAMPISPGVLYVSQNVEAEGHIGVASTPGFTKLCQTGMSMDRATELMNNMNVLNVNQTTGPVMPGESRTFEVDVKDKNAQGFHFETMYGKTKDVCGVISISKHSLTALSQHVTAQVAGKDQVVTSGAFTDPVVMANACGAAMNGVDCLRSLSTAKMGATQVRSFVGYLPSVLEFLETRYGAEDALSLLVPTAGAIRYSVSLKH